MRIKSSKNWVYGCTEPDNQEYISEELYRAHRYRNDLCEIELEKRKRHYEILRDLSPEYLDSENKITSLKDRAEKIRTLINKAKSSQRTNKPEGVERIVAELKSISKAVKEMYASNRDLKHAAYKDEKIIKALKENKEQSEAEQARAKLDCGLYWGTEGSIFNNCKAFIKGPPPKFKRYDGTGQLCTQIQKNANPNFLLRIEEPVDGKAKCMIRIGSTDAREPMFATTYIKMHRPLPPSSVIKNVFLEKRKIADKVRWSVRFVINLSENIERDKDSFVAIHYGWKSEPSGLRVALWEGSDGEKGALVLPNEHLASYEKIYSLGSERDIEFNRIISSFCDWIDKSRDLPDFIMESRPAMKKWKSPARLSHLIRTWREAGVDEDHYEKFDEIDAWRKSDKKKWQNESRLAKRVARRRTDMYRKFVLSLSRKYGVLYAGKIKVATLKKTAPAEDMDFDRSSVNKHCSWAAIGDLHRFMEERFPLHTINVNVRNLTKECSSCFEVNRVKKRSFTCSGCGKEWDQDVNALANTITRGSVMQEAGRLDELIEAHNEKEKRRMEGLVKMQDGRRRSEAAKKKKKEAEALAKAKQ